MTRGPARAVCRDRWSSAALDTRRACVAQPLPLTLADATARALERLPELAIQRDAITVAAQGEIRAAGRLRLRSCASTAACARAPSR